MRGEPMMGTKGCAFRSRIRAAVRPLTQSAGQKELKGFAFHSSAVRQVSASQNTMKLGFRPISAQDIR